MRASLYLLLCLLFASCHSGVSSDYAYVSGKIENGYADGDSIIVTFTVPNPIMNERTTYQTQVVNGEEFSFTIPVVCPVYAILVSSGCHGTILLEPGKEIELEIVPDSSGVQQIQMIRGSQLSKQEESDLNEVSMALAEMMMSDANVSVSDMNSISPEAWADSTLIRMNKDLVVLTDDEKLPIDLKQSYYHCCKLFFYLPELFFKYEAHAKLNYLRKNGQQDPDGAKFVAPQLNPSYYSFLKHFNFKEPVTLHQDAYAKALKMLLTKEALGILPIGDMPVGEWVKDTQSKLSDLLGFKEGLFYDLLAANAYEAQMANDLQPLSDKQQENIRAYFSNQAIVDILMGENEKAKAWDVRGMAEKPEVPKEQLLEAIFAPHAGKVIVVDFWATWCGPCVEAMYLFKDAKKELVKKDVVFIYFVDSSSSIDRCNKIANEIGGLHYFLTTDEWNYLSYQIDELNIYTPTYLLFDKNGKLVEKKFRFPGVSEMQQKIEALL